MKNWKSILAAIASIGAASAVFAQEAPTTTTTTTTTSSDGSTSQATTISSPTGTVTETQTTTPAGTGDTLELKTKHGTINAKKTVVDGKTSVNIIVSGIHSQAGIYGIMDDIKKAGDALAGDYPISQSAPAEPGAEPKGGIRGQHGTILAGKEVSNGKVTVDALVHSIPADVTAGELASDFLKAIANMVVEDQIQFAGKTLTLNADFVPGQDPVIMFTIDVPTVPEEPGADDVPDNTINVDDRDVTGI